MSEPKFYTVKEFAEILKVNEVLIHEWSMEGILKCIKIGGIIRIPESELERLLNGLKSKNKRY